MCVRKGFVTGWNDFVVLNLHNLVGLVIVIVLNLDKLDKLDNLVVVFTSGDGRQFVFGFFGVKHAQCDDLRGGEHPVFAIGGRNVNGALSVQFKQANQCATERALRGGLNVEDAPNQMNGFFFLDGFLDFFFLDFFFLDFFFLDFLDGFFFLDHAQDFCTE